MYGDAISKSITAFMVICAIAGGLAVSLCVWGIPWLWSLIKPWLNAVAA